MGITKDAEVVICFIYKIFLERRKEGKTQREAIRFNEDFYKSDKKLCKWHESDISDALLELAQKGYIKIYIGGDFDLLDNTIIYMESRFKNGIADVLELVSKLIP